MNQEENNVQNATTNETPSSVRIDDKKKKEKNTYYSTKPTFGKNGPSKIRQMFSKGMTYFLVIAASILFYFALLRLPSLSIGFEKVLTVLMPVMYGCAIAYLLNPIVQNVDRVLVPALQKKMKNQKKAESLSRGIGVFAAIVFLLCLVTILCNMLIPELYTSIRDLVVTLPRQIEDALDALNNVSIDDTTTGNIIKTAIEEGTNMFMTWLRTDLMAQTNEIMSNLTIGVINIVGTVFNILIGLIISVYILFSKERFVKQSKKLVYAVLAPNHANTVLHITMKTNEIFGGFIIGKLIDSAIIGVLCFVLMSIFNIPYAILVSVIVGVTNIIPFFGPYIGAIPSIILILLDDPIKGLYFLILIILLQQFDGNILGPKILGNSTGLSPFWVVVAILLGGGLFGFPGMILGVPTFAVLYYIAQLVLNGRLEKKNLPIESDKYDTMSYVDEMGNYVHSDKKQGE